VDQALQTTTRHSNASDILLTAGLTVKVGFSSGDLGAEGSESVVSISGKSPSALTLRSTADSTEEAGSFGHRPQFLGLSLVTHCCAPMCSDQNFGATLTLAWGQKSHGITAAGSHISLRSKRPATGFLISICHIAHALHRRKVAESTVLLQRNLHRFA
jgi:hypothetical protein